MALNCVKWHAQSFVYFRINQGKPSWKLESMVVTIYHVYKAISNINIVFSNCVEMRYTFAFSPLILDEYICWKSDHICHFFFIH